MSLSNHINQKIQQVGFPASPEKNLIFGHSPRVIMARESQKLLQAEEGAAGAATNGWPVVQPLDDHSDVVQTGRKGETEPERDINDIYIYGDKMIEMGSVNHEF